MFISPFIPGTLLKCLIDINTLALPSGSSCLEGGGGWTSKEMVIIQCGWFREGEAVSDSGLERIF